MLTPTQFGELARIVQESIERFPSINEPYLKDQDEPDMEPWENYICEQVAQSDIVFPEYEDLQREVEMLLSYYTPLE